jgi:hypothetical protein
MNKLHVAFLFFVGLVSMWSGALVNAQNTGTLFNFAAVPTNHNNPVNVTLFITTSANFSSAQISSPLLPNFITINEFNGTFTQVLPGSFVPVVLNSSQPLNQPSNFGIRITTSQPCSVQVVVNSTEANSGEGTFLLPANSGGSNKNSLLGTEYFTNGVVDESFTILATNNQTTNVTLNFTRDQASESFQLSDLQTLTFSARNLSGTHISSTQPVAVFVGNEFAEQLLAPSSCGKTGSCAYLLEQLVPAQAFGKNYIFVNPLGANAATNTTIRLARASNANVSVNVSGITVNFTGGVAINSPILLRQGYEAVSVTTNNFTHVISSNDSVDVQIVVGSSENNNFTQVGLIPNTQFINDAYFYVVPSSNSYMYVVASTADVTGVVQVTTNVTNTTVITNTTNTTNATGTTNSTNGTNSTTIVLSDYTITSITNSTVANSSFLINGVAYNLSLFQPTADPTYSLAVIKLNDSTNVVRAWLGHFIRAQV